MAEFNTEFANEYNTLANKLGIITCHFAEPCYNLVFYGILQTKKAPSKTRNIDYSASYMFLDPTITTPCHLLYFNSDLEMFPKIDPNGSVVVFNANIRVFNGKNQYYAQKSSPFALVDENSCDPKHRELVKMLCGWFNKTIIHQQPTSQSLKKDLRICDLHQDGSFFNFIGMIIHISTIESENGTQKLDLVVSDFTSNKKVKMAVGNVKLEYNLNSESVLLIHLWGSETNRYNLKNGEIYYFKNLNLRATNSNTFEAHLFPDKKYTEKEFIFPKCELDSEYSTIQNQKLNWIELNKPLTLVHSNLTITKIKDLGLGKLTSKYQLHAKIVDYRPSISKWSTIEGISFSLLLYDGSGFLTIAVNNKDAEMFFNGKCCVEGIKSLGVAEDTVNGVEFDLCVEEFCHGGYVYYRMFNTVLN